MEHVTDQTSNPFGMSAPCPRAVYGYGDVNADFHVIGDHPASHGGMRTGVPFTGTLAGKRLQDVLHEVGFATTRYSDEPRLDNCYLSYAYLCIKETSIDGEDPTPTEDEYADLERFLDAELRAINAHVLLPVGDRPLAYTLREHTTLGGKLPSDVARLHTRLVRGRGFLIVPVKEPAEWSSDDREALVTRLQEILESDYRQTKGIPTLVG